MLDLNDKQIERGAMAGAGLAITGALINIISINETRPDNYLDPGAWFPTGPDAAGILNLGGLAFAGVGCLLILGFAYLMKERGQNHNLLANQHQEEHEEVVPESRAEGDPEVEDENNTIK